MPAAVLLVAQGLRAPVDLPPGVGLNIRFTDEQWRAIETRDRPLFVHAGAGSGKTAVLVERFVRAAREDGAAVDSILAITFTEKAAAELRLRVRRRFLDLGDRERAREAERAWVSTIHGFCSRVLRAHALAAGLDPDYRVLDEPRAARLARAAFELALEEFMGEHAPVERLELLAAYTPDKLAAMVFSVHSKLRTQGQTEPRLPAAPPGTEHEAAAKYALLGELVPLYARRYREAKQARSVLDFEDLELGARDLLRERPGLRDRYRERFTQVMVDELQDTNRLQNEILELVAAANLFTVGDERQSIYSFRGGDVSVFDAHRRGAEREKRAARLVINFRSRLQILAVLNSAFAELPGLDLQAAQDEGAGSGDPPVELIVVDSGRGHWNGHCNGASPALGADPFGPGMRSVPVWRAAEARLLADRLAAGIAGGELEPGEVAVLVRAGTDLAVYERALEDRGIPTYVVGGRGYWSQQQVADLRSYLAALANPLDELALYTVLASPLVGASLDSIALLKLRSRALARDPWWALEAALCPDGDGAGGLAEALGDDRDRLEAFARRFARERGEASRVALEALIERAIADSGYDRHVLALPAGERRMANLRKLMRLAREYEAEEGRDLRGFIDFLDSQDLAQAREGEAPLETENVRAVRLMTIHAAKGLEFGVVCVADLGRTARGEDSPLRVSDDGRAGLELLSLGGERSAGLDLERIKEEEAARAEEEERRIFYVAMTRARRRLIVSGATNTEKWPEPKPLGAPMDWVWRALAPRLSADAAAASVGVTEQPAAQGRGGRVRYTLCSPDRLLDLLGAEARAPGRPRPSGERNGHEPPAPVAPAAPLAPPAALPVRRLSYSALATYARCPRCFYVERVLGLGGMAPLGSTGGEDLDDGDPDALERGGRDELPARLRGTVVHELLERLDFGRPAAPSRADVAALIERADERAGPAEVASIQELVQAFAGSAIRARLAAARRVGRELPFAFSLSPDGHGSLMVNGIVDARAVEADRTLIVDYKTDRLDGCDPETAVRDGYAAQRTIYALAELRAGARRVEVAHLFLERADEPAVAVFERSDAPSLEDRVLELVEGIVAGRFAASDGYCPDCARRSSWWRGDSVRQPG